MGSRKIFNHRTRKDRREKRRKKKMKHSTFGYFRAHFRSQVNLNRFAVQLNKLVYICSWKHYFLPGCYVLRIFFWIHTRIVRVWKRQWIFFEFDMESSLLLRNPWWMRILRVINIKIWLFFSWKIRIIVNSINLNYLVIFYSYLHVFEIIRKKIMTETYKIKYHNKKLY